jgi:hypothetical protein
MRQNEHAAAKTAIPHTPAAAASSPIPMKASQISYDTPALQIFLRSLDQKSDRGGSVRAFLIIMPRL